MGTLNKIQGFLINKIEAAKNIFKFTTHKAEPIFSSSRSSSRSSKQALSRRLRNYRQFRRHKNYITLRSRKINWE